MERTITEDRIEGFKAWLREDIRANEGTVNQYLTKLDTLDEFLQGREMTRDTLEAFKRWLVEERHYKKTSANSFIFAVRGFCRAMDWEDITIAAYALEPRLFNDGERYIDRGDYRKLVTAALYMEDYRLMMIIQTLCHMDLRFSELGKVTVEAVREGVLSITRRQHTRRMEIPPYLRDSLLAYARHEGIESGIVFRTTEGNLVNRSNIWKGLKKLCLAAGVDEDRVSLMKLKMPRMHDYYPFYPMVEDSLCGM